MFVLCILYYVEPMEWNKWWWWWLWRNFSYRSCSISGLSFHWYSESLAGI